MPRQSKRRPIKQTRVRSKRLDQLDETKLALALWLMAKNTLDPAAPADATKPAEQSEKD